MSCPRSFSRTLDDEQATLLQYSEHALSNHGVRFTGFVQYKLQNFDPCSLETALFFMYLQNYGTWLEFFARGCNSQSVSFIPVLYECMGYLIYAIYCICGRGPQWGCQQSVAKFFFKWPMQACQIIFSENLLYWGPILRFFSISTLMNTNLKLNKNQNWSQMCSYYVLQCWKNQNEKKKVSF